MSDLDVHETAAAESVVHQVEVARDRFEFEPVVDLPAWWTPGQRAEARRGDHIVVGEADYHRGRTLGAFLGEPAALTRTVTVRHGCFDYRPQPFPTWEPEYWRRTAFAGETINILEEDYVRGLHQGAFEEWQAASAYGKLGDPPLSGSIVGWFNWVQSADAPALDRLVADLAGHAGDDAERLAHVAEVRRLLVTERLEGGHLDAHLNRSHELVQQIIAPRANAGEAELEDLRRRILAGEITNPTVVSCVLGLD